MLSITSLTPGMLFTSDRAESRPTSVTSFAVQSGDAVIYRDVDKVELVVVADAVVVQLAIEFRFQFRVRSADELHRNSVADALHSIQLANFLGCIQLLLVQIHGAGKRHNAIFGACLQVAKFLFFANCCVTRF